MPTLLNRHHFHGKPLPSPHVYIGRGTPLGNDVSRRGDGPAEEMLAVYERWLREKVEARDAQVLSALNSITPGHFLVCSCAPAPCHGDVVLKVWDWLVGKGEF